MKTKHLLFFVVLLVAGKTSFAQWSNQGFTFKGTARQYRIYVPSMYNASAPASIVLTLHGMGDNMTNFSGIGMNHIADTANIIVVVPQAVTDPLAGTAWNSGAGYMGYYPNSTIDDVGFINALIDTVSAHYSINSQNVFCCGFSMGGFMTERLACQLDNKIRSFASVSGTFGSGVTCNPWRSVCVVHFHGTADATVPYTGGNYGVSVDSLINFWVTKNQCNTTAVHDSLPDTKNDGYTVEKFVYNNGLENTQVELYKVTGADHTWLTSANDISYSTEIWNFFRTCGGQLTGIENKPVENKFDVFPNPAHDYLDVSINDFRQESNYVLTITNCLGQVVYSTFLHEKSTRLNLKPLELSKGLFIVRVDGNNSSLIKKIVIE